MCLVKLCEGREDAIPRDLFNLLEGLFSREADNPSAVTRLLCTEAVKGEDLGEFSHALSTMFNAALQQSSNAVPDVQLALRDQFVERVRDTILWREPCKMVQDRPRVTLFEVREVCLCCGVQKSFPVGRLLLGVVICWAWGLRMVQDPQVCLHLLQMTLTLSYKM